MEQREQSPTGLSGQVNNQDKGWETAQDLNDDEDEEEYDDVLLFLPTGLSRPRPKTFYKGSDPEWQEFKRIAADQARAEKIRRM